MNWVYRCRGPENKDHCTLVVILGSTRLWQLRNGVIVGRVVVFVFKYTTVQHGAQIHGIQDSIQSLESCSG